jgi:hypothetical protein
MELVKLLKLNVIKIWARFTSESSQSAIKVRRAALELITFKLCKR